MKNPITIDPDIQFGTPVFTGTRVPVESLFWHLESGISLDIFLTEFPSVSREQAISVLDLAGKALSSDKLLPLIYEITA
ncbi:DUF433 domain-containing protein [Spirosoma sp. KCTC 42546]|uniref:DUF433 domain-containing protein n=1 Tax=Spirosoma sp. KCTC 42546 TaxID=2520506 RepID=UPI001157BD23|nr:DUF433 domain-containing protein [Spirosoma sp. KCTC 42546]QDK77629.1 DUF433 domain-containing protein [Spirosoma sp. KCTC 42546]